jgi:CheY-like chemotaxis protein
MTMIKGSRTCFLIDDDADDQEIFGLALRAVDSRVQFVTADDGIDALEKLNDDPVFTPDFIFLDLNMPRMGGKECLRELKKIPRLDGVKIVVYTTSIEERDKKEMMAAGASYFLTKPADIGHLKEALASIIGSTAKSQS